MMSTLLFKVSVIIHQIDAFANFYLHIFLKIK